MNIVQNLILGAGLLVGTQALAQSQTYVQLEPLPPPQPQQDTLHAKSANFRKEFDYPVKTENDLNVYLQDIKLQKGVAYRFRGYFSKDTSDLKPREERLTGADTLFANGKPAYAQNTYEYLGNRPDVWYQVKETIDLKRHKLVSLQARESWSGESSGGQMFEKSLHLARVNGTEAYELSRFMHVPNDRVGISDMIGQSQALTQEEANEHAEAYVPAYPNRPTF